MRTIPIKQFLVFLFFMLIAQIVILVLSFAMGMDGANHYSSDSNFLYGMLKNILGFPLYLIADFDGLVTSREFEYELIPLFIGNTFIQFSLISLLKYKLRKD